MISEVQKLGFNFEARILRGEILNKIRSKINSC